MNQREHASLQTRDGEAMSLLGLKLSADVRGLMLEASVEQRFCNPTDTHVEVVYSFPLPWGAVLLGVDVVLGGKRLTGAVVEKKQAEAQYEEAISEGNAAIMLEKNSDHSYSLNLGNLAAREHCVITLRYAQTLQFEQRGLRLMIPTVMAPRYEGALPSRRLLAREAPGHSLTADYPFDLELRLHGALAQSRVASPSHPVGVLHSSSTSVPVLTVSLARRASLDRDFILVVDQLVQESMVVAAKDGVEPECVAVLASFCPRIPAVGKATTAVKILVDCSGSMTGDSIDSAKRALQAIVLQLTEGDRFALSRFGSNVEHRSRGLWKAGETTRLAAQRWVGELQADLGGTEMEAALTSTFALAQTVSSDVLLVTDGEITAIDSTIEAAKASGHRLFVVGIGSSPAEAHLRRLAEATGGACDFVAPGEAVEPAVLRMFARLRSPRVAGLSLVWPEGVTPAWVSPLLPSVFDGDTVNVFALLRNAASGEVRLQGVRSEDEAMQVIGSATLALAGELGSADTLPRMVAAARVKFVEAEDSPAAGHDATGLAVAYQLVTDNTNFLLVHERADGEKALDMPVLQKVEQMMPAGWGGAGSVMFSRRIVSASVAFDPQPTVPKVWRSMRRSMTQHRGGQSINDFDIPSFLSKNEEAIDRNDPRHWTHSEHYTGLTPLGVYQWLSNTPASDWPTSFGGLRGMGLGAWLVEWLELVMATHAGAAHAEADVVRAFLHLMSSSGTRDLLAPTEGVVGVFKSSVQRLRGMLSAELTAPGPVDLPLVGAMADALEGMTAEAWPDTVFAMSESLEDTRDGVSHDGAQAVVA